MQDIRKEREKVCYDKFRVTKMEVDGGSISSLEIENDSLNRKVYGSASAGTGDNRGSVRQVNGKQGNNAPPAENRPQGNTQQQRTADEQANAEMMERANKALIDGTKVKVIRSTIRKKGLSEASILGHYNLKKFEDMTMAHWTNAMQLLDRYKDKEGNA